MNAVKNILLELSSKLLLILFIPLGMILGCQGKKNAEHTLLVEGSETEYRAVKLIAEDFNKLNPNFEVRVNKTTSLDAIRELKSNEVNLAMSSRPMNDAEIREFYGLGLQPTEVLFSRDLLAVVVNQRNPITEIRFDDIQDIYAGKIVDWQELTGVNGIILPISYNVETGVYQVLLKRLRLNNYSLTTKLFKSSDEVIELVSKMPTAIGFVSKSALISKIPPNIKVIPVANVLSNNYINPMTADFADAVNYPFTRDLYQYYVGKGKVALTAFIEYQQKYSPTRTKEAGLIPTKVIERKLPQPE